MKYRINHEFESTEIAKCDDCRYAFESDDYFGDDRWLCGIVEWYSDERAVVDISSKPEWCPLEKVSE